MNRTWRTSLLLLIVLMAMAQSIFSQQTRTFPVESQLGNLTSVSFPVFVINNQQMQMGPGGQIRGIDNLIILPNAANYVGLIRYQLDFMGNLHRVWILTPDEVKEAENQGQQIHR